MKKLLGVLLLIPCLSFAFTCRGGLTGQFVVKPITWINNTFISLPFILQSKTPIFHDNGNGGLWSTYLTISLNKGKYIEMLTTVDTQTYNIHSEYAGTALSLSSATQTAQVIQCVIIQQQLSN